MEKKEEEEEDEEDTAEQLKDKKDEGGKKNSPPLLSSSDGERVDAEEIKPQSVAKEYTDEEEDEQTEDKADEEVEEEEEEEEAWEKHHITEYSLAERDYFCFGLFDYIPSLSRGLASTWYFLRDLICIKSLPPSFSSSRKHKKKKDHLLPFIAPSFLQAIHWALRMAFATLLGSVLCLTPTTADYLPCTFVTLSPPTFA